jgi:plastocyanin
MKSGSYKKKLTRTGTYRIVCTIHADQGMLMTLKVK